MNQTKKANYSDWLGAMASGLCIVHCELTPLIFTAKPIFYGMIGKPIHQHGLWTGLDYVFLILSLLAVWYSARHTPYTNLRWMLWVAWTVFACGLLLESHTFTSGHWLMYVGSATLVFAHFKNYYHGQQSRSIELKSNVNAHHQ